MAKSKSRLANVSVSDLRMDLARNPRFAVSYDVVNDKALKLLIADIQENGFRGDKPLVVSDRGKDGLWVVQGHRRLTAAKECNKRNPSMCNEVPCIIYTDLSMDDERKMLVDQFLVKALSPAEQYLAVKQLLLVNGMTEDKIAAQVGMSRGWVQRKVWIAKFPPEVEKEWLRKEQGEEGHLPITDPVLQQLKKAYEQDKEVGRHQDEGGGPALREVWQQVKNRDPLPKDPKAMTRKEILEKTEILRDKIVIAVMKYCAGDPINIADVQEQLSILYAKAGSWDESQRDSETGEQKQA